MIKGLIKLICIVVFLFINNFSQAQPKKYTVAHAHSHNDYLNDQPFQRAWKNGFGSIEADIFPVNGVLCVAHSKNEIRPERTLKKLYLDPLLYALKNNKSRRIKLLIDIKEDHTLCLDLLIREIEPLKKYLTTSKKSKAITILISGERPAPKDYKNYPDYIFFDDDLKISHTAAEWERVGQVSLSFTKFSAWKGIDSIPSKDKKLLKQVIDSVHLAGKTIRFWAAPDTEISWLLQMELGADLIGTDKIDELAGFLRRRSKAE
jgi:alkaline phosphatase